MEYASFLRRHIEEIVPLSDEEFGRGMDFFTAREVQKKDLLLRVGQPVHLEWLVVKGCLKSSAYDDEGHEFIMQFALENWWVSDYPGYMQEGNAEMEVRALERSWVLEISKRRREAMCREVPAMYIFYGRKAMGGFAGSQKSVLSLLRNSAKEKYELLLDLYPELFQRLPHKSIAHYLGLSRETLSRMQRKKG